ncbi:hypothetical protein A5667_04845 [Mycolicibacterium fortuitum]|uniref:DUF4239 domain-containing protein n=1 Tax=Mycolicibacterium fortuitum TaxID=1766 RepID=A0ABD6QRE3_MYCFO|nr:DUF4239 domain-containing protein [Mycolicibacterium fortuitum]OBA93440.1 hypothetical protein A5665_09710 [Mycolicibacterium fortuitum]OBI63694.1 hypothetical protein A5667_04845 [Mycolicibacterium fortuitum]OBI66515.1 hypothetical protein A5666_04505 [Mycolicibacterium fortuitum]OMC48779.1 hypothetical protein A5742_21715 [Mycolicibacterium fortuitum]UBV17916.1 DUF4239 domain-containing protein [Mycolicibacterium fortuitum]
MGDFGLFGTWLLLAVVVVGAVALAVGSVLLASRVIARDTRPEHNSVLSPFLTVVGLVYGALLGFTVVVGWQQYLSAQTNVSNEASTLVTMYRQTVAMPQPEQTQVREQLRRYAAAVQGPEWGKEEFGTISNNGRHALTEMYRIVGTAKSDATASPINSQFLSQLATLTSDRSARILNSSPRIPVLLWCALIFGSLVLITLASFMRLENSRAHMILVSTVTVLLALLLFLVFMLDHPYGPVGVTPQRFAHAVMVFDLIDKGT